MSAMNNKAKVLIVDDEKQNREALKRAIGDENPEWEIFLAENEEEGLDIVRDCLANAEPIDVVLTDLVMRSEQSGMTMLEQARAIDPLIMSILFTAKEKNLDRYAAFDYGAFDVVEKNIRGKTAVQEINIKAERHCAIANGHSGSTFCGATSIRSFLKRLRANLSYWR